MGDNVSPGEFLKLHKKIVGGGNRSSIPTLMENNQSYSRPVNKANLLCDCYAFLSTAPDMSSSTELDLPMNERIDHKCLTDIIITDADVLESLRLLKTKSAMGPDNIGNIILKTCANVLTPSLNYLFNMSIRVCKFPD